MKLINRTGLMLGATMLATSLSSFAYSEYITGYEYKTLEVKARTPNGALIDAQVKEMNDKGWELVTDTLSDRHCMLYMTFRKAILSGDVDFEEITG